MFFTKKKLFYLLLPIIVAISLWLIAMSFVWGVLIYEDYQEKRIIALSELVDGGVQKSFCHEVKCVFYIERDFLFILSADSVKDMKSKIGIYSEIVSGSISGKEWCNSYDEELKKDVCNI